MTYRDDIRAFLDARLPGNWPGLGGLSRPDRAAFLAEWRAVLLSNRMLGLTWPTSYGGGGRDTYDLAILLEEFIRRGVPAYPSQNDVLGINLLGPTLLAWGTDDQKQRFLAGTLSGEYVWAQGFSEPEAGSDLFALRTTGVVDGDELVINGQKVWQSSGLAANWLFAIVRTDPGAARAKGLSFVLIPLRTPGVEVRGIRDLTGNTELAEVFFTDARVPLDNVVGGAGHGAQVALTLLGFERGAGGIAAALALEIELDRLLALARGRGAATDPLVRSRIAQCYATVSVLRSLAVRTLARLRSGAELDARSSVTKLVTAEYHQTLTALAMEILGPEALVPTGEPATEWLRPQPLGADPLSSRAWVEDYLNARAGTIYGGSAEIQRNTIAERILGMPREPRP